MECSSQKLWWSHLAWAFSAGLLGFVVAGVFAGVFQLPRDIYLIPYVLFVIVFLYAYLRWSRVDMTEVLLHHLV